VLAFWLTEIIYDDSDFIHISPEDITPYLIPISDDYVGIAPAFIPEVYVVGSRREFFANGRFGQWGELVRQGDHVNIWVLDPAAGAIPPLALDNAILRFDDITYRMTRDFAPFRDVRVVTNFNTMPLVGDVHNDGRVNVLLYGSNTGGYFTNRHFMIDDVNVPIAMFHVNASGGISDSTFAHELQHLLFYMHFGVYAGSYRQSFLWLDEALSELAAAHWTTENGLRIQIYWIHRALENSYANPNDWRVGDFVNFNNSGKNYGMSKLHGFFMHQRTAGDYVSFMYDSIRATVPTSTTAAEFRANEAIINTEGMVRIVGDAFYAAGLTGSTGASGELAFNLLYFLFMENFAADGGYVVNNNVFHPTRKFLSSSYSAYNLWGARPYVGSSRGLFQNSTSPWADVLLPLGMEAFPVLTSGENVSLSGFNGTPAHGTTHERFYRLTGQSAASPILSISINDNDPRTQYYIVIRNEIVGAGRQAGRNGATVHVLTRDNVENLIDTGGQIAYLFVVTLNRNVNATVTYSWQDEIYVPETHRVTFALAGGEYNGDDALLLQYVVDGANAVALTADPTRDGYTFNGWIPELNLANVTEARSFVAQWVSDEGNRFYVTTWNGVGTGVTWAINQIPAGGSGTIVLLNDIPQASGFTIPNLQNREITITSSSAGPFTITMAGNTGNVATNHFVLQNGTTLVLENIVLDGNGAGAVTNRGGVTVNSGAHLIMNAGSVITNARGSGVFVGNGLLTMNPGSVISHNFGDLGGGVFVAGRYGYASITGAEISNNTATSEGGGLFVEFGRVTMTDSRIINNIVQSDGGGGVGLRRGGSLTMYSGEISGNTVTGTNAELSHGGGVILLADAGGFTMHGGEIRNNSAQNGGGIWWQSEGLLPLITIHPEAEFSGNIARDAGVRVNNALAANNPQISPATVSHGTHTFNNLDIFTHIRDESVNLTHLLNAITQAESRNPNNYTELSWTWMQHMKNAAIWVSTQPDATQQMVDTATDQLLAAIAALVVQQ